ncbi:hypothetical protein AOA59_21320 [Pseudomonas sp. 2822-15]|uniref:Uncharacterized protein n=1 Tax=Pseudomonas salomonii TaxID=191391 RepID=A0A1H3UFN6_9PSED|nr:MULTISPECIES: hypothetical protein [Pseudomonas]NWF11627.1 hypothetical protein [Pseudomonas salomonii]PIB42589.1 hypothetical protein AOA59_21320 [Pseudomonas sp. 2822-15]CRM72050.1 hypothetical protein [Pseudomonas sp. 58 R 3]SDZ61282.1 hypothetical protein SAMN05216247_1147 [Pseudomonas salomonii]
MSTFEPGQYVRLRSGGKRMLVKPALDTSQLPNTELVLCEYEEKKRRVQGFYIAANLTLVNAAPNAQNAEREASLRSKIARG